MASRRAGVAKPKPELYFEQIPVEFVKEVAKTSEKKPKIRLSIRRPRVAGR